MPRCDRFDRGPADSWPSVVEAGVRAEGGLQLLGRPGADNVAAVHCHDAVAPLVGLLHAVRDREVELVNRDEVAEPSCQAVSHRGIAPARPRATGRQLPLTDKVCLRTVGL